jgi:hypothetical protein
MTETMKRTDKWSPTNIDWTTLVPVLIIEKEFEWDEERGKEYAVPYDYPVVDNLPAEFFTSTDNGYGIGCTADRSTLNAYYSLRGLGEDHECVCGHCGHALRYGAVLVNRAARDGLMVGFDCLEIYKKVVKGFVPAQRAARLAAEAASKDARARQFCSAHVGLADAFTTDHYIVRDIHSKLRQYGSISQPQIDLVFKIAREWAEGAEAREVAAARVIPDAPEGKVTVEGVILGFKTVDGYAYNTKITKMIVESDEGWKVYVTVPAYFRADKGDRVQFGATLQQSRGDAKFAYGKRPTKAVNLTHADDEVEEDCPQMKLMTAAKKARHFHDGHGCEVRA